NPARHGRVLHASDHSFLIVNIMQHAITYDDVEIAIRGIIDDIGNRNVYPVCYARVGGKSPDLGGADLTYLYCVDEIAEQRQPDRVSSFAGSYVKRPARRPAGESTEGHLGEQRGRVVRRVETIAVVLMPPVTLLSSVEIVEELAYFHRADAPSGSRAPNSLARRPTRPHRLRDAASKFPAHPLRRPRAAVSASLVGGELAICSTLSSGTAGS